MHIININHGNHSHSWPSTCEDNKSYLHRIATKNRLNWWGNMCLQRALTTSSVAVRVAFCHRLPQNTNRTYSINRLLYYIIIGVQFNSMIRFRNWTWIPKSWFGIGNFFFRVAIGVSMFRFKNDSRWFEASRVCLKYVWMANVFFVKNTEYYAPTSKDCRGGSYLLSKQKSRIP